MKIRELRERLPQDARYAWTAAVVCVLALTALVLWYFLDAPGEAQAAREVSLPDWGYVALTGFDSDGNSISRGTGFFAFSGDLVVTSFHAIDYCSQITVSAWDGTEYRVSRIVAYDAALDAAILRVSRNDSLAALPCGSSSDIQPGDPLSALGGEAGGMAFAGRTNTESGAGFLAVSCPPGVDSGTALLNSSGQVVGMAVSSGNGTALAVPIESIQSLLLRSETEITPNALCEAEHPGLDKLRTSTPVDFYTLLSQPERWEGMRIRLVGRAAYTEEYAVSARKSLIFLLPPGSPVPEETPVVAPWEGVCLDGYYFYWFFTPFSESRVLRCIDGTHTLKTARYQGEDVLVCGIYHYETDGGYASLELLYTDTPQVLDILPLD